jgi:argininosuccinate lyase
MARLARDLMTWSESAHGMVWLPDHLVGSSSMMPQKRNPFFLEHVIGRCSRPAGAFAAAASAMLSAPFTNAIAVSSEAVSQLPDTLAKVAEAAVLLRMVVAEAEPQVERMRGAAEAGLTSATECASHLARESVLGFREAHMAVGRLISDLEDGAEGSFPVAASTLAASYGVRLSPETLEPAAIARRAEYGGGPGPTSLLRALEAAKEPVAAARRAWRCRQERWRSAAGRLDSVDARLRTGRD